MLAANFNATGNWLAGNFNGDALVDIGDFALLAGNFNQTTPVECAACERSRTRNWGCGFRDRRNHTVPPAAVYRTCLNCVVRNSPGVLVDL